MGARGGAQHIPRPDSYEIVGPAPWAHLGLADRPVSLEQVRRSVTEHHPALPAPDIPTARPTAVLVPVFEVDGEAHVVLTKRPDTMPSHQGQIAFPGGKYEAELDASLTDTALREAEEEIALGREHVDV